jgi:hypothetical protein
VSRSNSGLKSRARRPGRPQRPGDHLWAESRVAPLVNVSRATLRRWRKQNKGPPFFKLGPEKGAAVRYDLDDVESWLAARRSGGE